MDRCFDNSYGGEVYIKAGTRARRGPAFKQDVQGERVCPSLEAMNCNLILSWFLLLTALEPFLAHSISYPAEMSYTGPVSLEEDKPVSPEELSYPGQVYLPQGSATLDFRSLFTGDMNGGGLRTAGLVPGQTEKEVLLQKPLLNPLSHFLGGRRQYRKRGSNTECFWKYCV